MRAIDGDKLKRKVQKVATEAWKMKLTARVETVLNQCIDYIDNAPTIEPEQRWIPCSERLPEMTHFMQDVNPFSDDVLVTIRNEYGAKCLLIGFFDSQHGWLFRDPRPIDGFTWKPIAWQPLSESYKEEGDQDD